MQLFAGVNGRSRREWWDYFMWISLRYFLSLFFSLPSPGGCAGMHHIGLHSVSMHGPSAAAVGSAAPWLLESVCKPHGNPPLFQAALCGFTCTALDKEANHI